MAKTLTYIEELAEATLKDLMSAENWKQYLQTALHLYKYPFFDSVLIYAQKPDATAVASYELWNNKLHRYINRGANGIALIQTNSRKANIKYVFDVSDTNGEKEPYVWQFKNEYDDLIADEIADQFDVSIGGSFQNTINNTVDAIVEDNLHEYLNNLKEVLDDSLLEDLDELNLDVWYRDLIKESVTYTVLLRCGYDSEDISNRFEFSNLYNFNTIPVIVQLGEATSDFSQMILREVERSVNRIEKAQRIERRKSNDRIQNNERNQLSQLENERTERANIRETRHDAQDIPTQTPQGNLLNATTNRQTDEPMQDGGVGNTSGDRQSNPTDETNRTQPTRMGNTLDGDRGTSDTGVHLSQIDEASDVETVILSGSHFEGGKQRIIDYFAEQHTLKEKADFLKNEYGIGGGSVTFSDERRGYADYNSKGIEIHSQGFDHPSIKLTWLKVATLVEQLIGNEKYFEPRYPNEDPLIKRKSIKNQLSFEDIEPLQAEKEEFIPLEPEPIPNQIQDEQPKGADEAPFLIDENVDEPPKPTPIDYHITDDDLGIGGPKEKFRRNVEAIKLLKHIENEHRLATAEEQTILSQYIGFGGLANAFDESKDDWSNEYEELVDLLDSTEYTQARASVLDAYYTPPVVIKAVYQAIENMGFTDGNVLEPAMGVGNFFGLMPERLQNANRYGVEIDSITGRIAQQLYQNANISVQGYETTNFPDNFFDLAIGNVPFGSFGVSDKKYDQHKFMIHDYFFAKTLDKVRAGGIIAFITSKGTMDKQNPSVRKYIAQRAELIGAIRLPNTAFKANAGTQVTSDILFLKKRNHIIDIEPDWVHLSQTQDGIPINQYFVDHPEMILGTMVSGVGLYGKETDTACLPFKDSVLAEQLSDAILNINAEFDLDLLSIDEPEQEVSSIPAIPDVKNYSYTLFNDIVYYRENSRMYPVDVNATSDQRIRGLIGLRDAVQTVIAYQLKGHSLEDIHSAQAELNQLYDVFVSDYGRINSRANNLAFRDDNAYYLLCSLEILDDKQRFKRKADLFSKLTIRPHREITHVDTASEALALSLARKGHVDLGYICRLTNKDADTTVNQLQGIIFKNPLADPNNIYDGWETADEYLSGNVRNKLEIATRHLDDSPMFEINTQALKNVQPKDLEASDIDVRLGTVWIPPKDIELFIYETLETPNYYKMDIHVHFSPHSANWNIDNKSID